MEMQVEHAVADGYDVRGLMYWTLMDNFEVSRGLTWKCPYLQRHPTFSKP